jgi:ABC-2 type transport system permease protein
MPVSRETIFRWKFIESTLLASWAFLFLIAPLLAAYGLTHRVPWHFYPVTFVLIGLFIFLPAVAGSWLAVNLARYMDRRAFQICAIVGAIGILIVVAFWLKPEPITDEMLETRVLAVLDRLLLKTRFAQFPLLPSYWLSAGVLNWAEGALATSGFFGLVLLSYVLFFGFVAFEGMGRHFYEAASTVQSRGSVLARWGWFRRWSERRREFTFPRGAVETMCSWLFWIRTDTRAVVAKDIRVFWRDTTQWGQTLVLFGLLGVYILNLRHFSRQLTNPFWVNLVSYLNLGACSLNLATLTTRFVFPQFSLEGKRMWIVGMAPLGLVRIVKAKFTLATLASLSVTLGLISLSCGMLKMPWHKTLYFVCAVGVMTFSLNGLAMGLGALYPNFKEENPSKIVSGFGGTFCLVLSFLYILASVILLALGANWPRFTRWPNAEIFDWIGWGGFLLLSFIIGYVPLRLGLRRVTKIEI